MSSGSCCPSAVEGDHTLGAAGQRLGEAQRKRRTLSASSRRAQNVGARRGGRGGAAVGRAVVHHDDRAVGDGPRHQAADGGGLVEDGDDRDVVAHARLPDHHGRPAAAAGNAMHQRGGAIGTRGEGAGGGPQRSQPTVLAEEGSKRYRISYPIGLEEPDLPVVERRIAITGTVGTPERARRDARLLERSPYRLMRVPP
jgi:hypothetical protein